MVNSSRNDTTIIFVLFFFVAVGIGVMPNINFFGFFRHIFFLDFFPLYTRHIYHFKLGLFNLTIVFCFYLHIL